MKCENCKKELTKDMPIEYSKYQTCYFCNFFCAEQWAFEFCDIAPLMQPLSEADKIILFPNREKSALEIVKEIHNDPEAMKQAKELSDPELEQDEQGKEEQ